ncbi:unnamed protein product, partial [Brassica napus]
NKRTRRERKCTFRQEWQSMQKSCGSCWKKKDNTFVYMCGLKGMEKGIDEIMISLAAKDGWGILNRDRLVGVQEAIKEE